MNESETASLASFPPAAHKAVTRPQGRPSFLALGALTALYFAAGKLGLSFAVVNASASAVWPPAGVAVAALLVLGRGAWPAVATGAFLVNLSTSGSIGASALIAAGNTLEGLAAAWLVTRFAGGRGAFDGTGNIVRFTALAAGVAPTIAASVGTAALALFGLAGRTDLSSIWLTWWLGDASGTLVFGPLLILCSAPGRRAWTPARVGEAVALAAGAVGLAMLVFEGSPAGQRRLPLQFLEMPMLLWAAFRFGARETALVALVQTAFAVHGTLAGYGPFVRSSLNESLLLVQAFAGVVTVVMLCVAAEITARRIAEGRLRALNQELEQRVAERTEEVTRVHTRLVEAQEVAHVGSWEWDVAANTHWWSEEMCRIYGVVGAPASYDGYLARVHPDDRPMVEATVREAMHTVRPFTFEHRILRSDGAIRMLHARGRVEADVSGSVVRMMGTGHDITDLRAAEKQRIELLVEQAARRDAERANRAKDQFLATLSHELRTPLNVAHGWTHILRGAAEWNDRTARAVAVIHRNLELLTQLVSDILDVSRITAGALAVDLAEVSLSDVAGAAIETVRDAAAERRIAVETRIDSALPPVRADARRLQQIIWNLLSNAVKFAPEGGSVVLTADRIGNAVRIVVEDDGPGIDPAFLPHVFDEFRQGDSSVTRIHGGLGLGLAIARHLVELHRGTISAGNRAAGGAVFTICLPLHPEAAGVRPQESGLP